MPLFVVAGFAAVLAGTTGVLGVYPFCNVTGAALLQDGPLAEQC